MASFLKVTRCKSGCVQIVLFQLWNGVRDWLECFVFQSHFLRMLIRRNSIGNVFKICNIDNIFYGWVNTKPDLKQKSQSVMEQGKIHAHQWVKHRFWMLHDADEFVDQYAMFCCLPEFNNARTSLQAFSVEEHHKTLQTHVGHQLRKTFIFCVQKIQSANQL